MQLLIIWLCAIYASALAFFLILSLPRLRCWLYAFKKQERLTNDKQNKLAILIPARNESLSVGTLFDCLCSQDYPRECFDVHVIVADENDKTVELATERGFESHAVPDQTCKSDALDACLQGILSSDKYSYDAYIIIDADCGLAPDFLTEMNNALASGADIICSKKVVKNYFFADPDTCPLSASCNGLIWTFLDGMGNKFKSRFGYPCFTVGTGLMLRANVISDLGGWHYRQTLTEDVELMHDATLAHRKFFYYEHALLYMEEAQKLSETNKRRRRWLTGVVECERLYGKRVAKECSAGDRYYTSALNPIYGYVGTSAFFAAVCALLAIIFAALGIGAWTTLALLSLMGIAVIYISFLITTAFALICDAKSIPLSPLRKTALLFVHPLFYMQYITIIGRALLFPKKKHVWEAIERVDFSK